MQTPRDRYQVRVEKERKLLARIGWMSMVVMDGLVVPPGIVVARAIEAWRFSRPWFYWSDVAVVVACIILFVVMFFLKRALYAFIELGQPQESVPCTAWPKNDAPGDIGTALLGNDRVEK